MEHAEMATRPTQLEHGEAYTPTCHRGFTMYGEPFRCNAGKLDGVAQCKPDACAVSPPLHGTLGSCKQSLKHAESCMPSCDDGFAISGGPLTCQAGQLNGSFACVPQSKLDTLTKPLTMCRIASVRTSNEDKGTVFSYADLTRIECDRRAAELNQQSPNARFTATWVDLVF